MTRPEKIRILIVDDYDLLRKGLRVFVETTSDLECVGEASDGVEAIELCNTLVPDVVLMDMAMPRMGGAEAMRLIRATHPHMQCVALSGFSDESSVQAALAAGAVSYLLKSISAEDLAQAIRDAHAGKSTLAREAAQVLVDAAHRPQRPDSRLTHREREVLRHMVRGLNNHQIADELAITLSTVKKHVSSILLKFEIANRTEAVAMAVKQNLVERNTHRNGV